MKRSYGERKMTKPEGMLREIYFPTLALVDTRTGDGRKILSSGFGVRDLPLTVYAQFTNVPAHMDAVIAARLDEVTVEEDGNVSGWGWILDDDNGRQLVFYGKTQALRGNSVDLADVKAHYEWDEEMDDISIIFEEANVAATTIVAKPAFKEARYEIPDETVASWFAEADPLVLDIPFSVNFALHEPEVTADGAPRPSWDLFHQPEPDQPVKLHPTGEKIGEFELVVGHLALWDSCHDGIEGRCLRTPRPEDNYASFNKPGVLTDKGMVNTGPIFLAGGHRSLLGKGDPSPEVVAEAYGGIENAWADVKIVAGRLGPWCSGYVRPGADEATVTAARASRVSGHWLGSRLKAIVSVNAEGYDVPGDEFTLRDGEVVEMVAGLSCSFDSDNEVTVYESDEDDADEFDIDALLLDMDFNEIDV